MPPPLRRPPPCRREAETRSRTGFAREAPRRRRPVGPTETAPEVAARRLRAATAPCRSPPAEKGPRQQLAASAPLAGLSRDRTLRAAHATTPCEWRQAAHRYSSTPRRQKRDPNPTRPKMA